MNYLRTLPALAAIASLSFGSPATAGPKDDLAEAASYDGLQKIKVSGIDLAYALPGATLARYSRVMIEPVEVSFDKNWKADKPGTRSTLSADEQLNIRSGVAKIVYD